MYQTISGGKNMAINPLLKKLEEKFNDIPDFRRRTGCPISRETCRLAIYEDRVHPDNTIGAAPLMVICKHLGFHNNEIRKILKDSGDTTFHPLIGDTPEHTLSPTETSILEAVNIIIKKSPTAINNIADNLDLIARAAGVDISTQVKKLKLTKRGGRYGNL